MAQRKKGPKAEITSIKTMRSPKGIAAYAYLTKPDQDFDKYKITVLFDKKDPEYVAFVKELKALAKEAGVKNLPIKLVDEKFSEKVGQPVGTPYVKFELDAEREGKPNGPIPTFNAAGKKDDTLQVYGGDIVRAEGRLVSWTLSGDSGLKFYLKAVQMLKSNWKGGAGSTFTEEAEYLADAIEDDGEELIEEEDSLLEEEMEEEAEDEEDTEDEDDPTEGLL